MKKSVKILAIVLLSALTFTACQENAVEDLNVIEIQDMRADDDGNNNSGGGGTPPPPPPNGDSGGS